jgi:hypothetical protein
VQSDEGRSFDTLKTLAAAGPLALTTLAVTYDVGFFYGIGIGFFSFFSLAEHLVFALQSIPFFIPPVVVLSSWYASSVIGYRRGYESGRTFVAGLKDTDPATMEKLLDAKIKKNRKYHLMLAVPISVLLVASAALLIYKHFYLVGAFSIVLAMLSCISLLQHFEVSDQNILTKVGLVLCALAVTFAVGVQRAEDIMTSKTATETVMVDDKTAAVRLIRGGDKGVLLYAIEDKAIRFLKWDAIKDIRTVPPSS